MEAVPKLPLLSFELKTSPETTHFAPKLRQYIAEAYREDPDAYSNELHQLEGLRSAAVRPTNDSAGLAAMVRYFCQLRAMQSRFPMAKGQPAACTFAWKDLYTNMTCSIADIRFEMACILYNIGALHTQLGASEPRTTEDSMKAACLHYQNAAWAFQHLREQYPQPLGVDVATDIMRILQEICFAQAQECILDKSIQDTRKTTVIGAVATQVLYFYKNCLALLGPSGGTDTVYEIVAMKLYNYWHRHLSFKVSYIGCLVCLYQGMNAEEQQKMGERVAFYQLALERLNDARKLAKYIEPVAITQEALTFTNDVVEGKRKAAKNENEFIYHEEVPEKELLTDLKPVSLVKAVPINCNDPNVAGPDLFSRLVPMGAHEASSLYSEEKAKLLRQIAGQAEEKTTELTEFMSSLQLDQLDVLDADQKIPQEIVDRCAAMNAKTDIIQSLIDSMNNLAEIISDVEHSLAEIKSLIQEETLKEKEFQKAMGPRPPSIVQTELSREYHKYQEAHSRTNESNQVLHKAMTLHIANLKLLSQPLDVLHSKIPSIDNIEGLDRATMLEMRRVVAKAREMQTQRDCLIQQLREAINNDDVTGKLLARGATESTDEIFKQELDKHTPQVKIIEQNLAAQENIINKLTSLYAAYGESRRLLSDVLRKRDGLINALITSYDTYEELLGKSQKGLEFYKKLSHNVNQLLSRLKSTCQVQEEERAQQLATQTGKAAAAPRAASPPAASPPAPAAGLQLKDYLPYMKSRGLARNIPAAQVPDVLPTDTYYPENIYPTSIRPPPLGSEAADLSQPALPDGVVLPTSTQNIDYNRYNPYASDPQSYPSYNYPTTSAADYDKKLPDEIQTYAYSSYTPPQFSANNAPGQYATPYYSAAPNTMTTVTDSPATLGYNPTMGLSSMAQDMNQHQMGQNGVLGQNVVMGQNTMTSQNSMLAHNPVMGQNTVMGQNPVMGHSTVVAQNPVIGQNAMLGQNTAVSQNGHGQNPIVHHNSTGVTGNISQNPLIGQNSYMGHSSYNPYDQMQGMHTNTTDTMSISSMSSNEHAELNANFAQMQVGNKYEQIVPETDYTQYYNQQTQVPQMNTYNVPPSSQPNLGPSQLPTDYNQMNPQGTNQNNPYQQNTNQYNAALDLASPYSLQTVPNIPSPSIYNQEYGYGTSGSEALSQSNSFYTSAGSSFTTNVSTAAAMSQPFMRDTPSNTSLAYLDALDQPIKSHVKREALSAVVPDFSTYSQPSIVNYPTDPTYPETNQIQYSDHVVTSNYNQTFQNHPGYSFNPTSGAFDYNYGSQNSFTNYVSSSQEIVNAQSMDKDSNWTAQGVYTSAGVCQTLQSPSEVPAMPQANTDQMANNQVYYNSPYGYVTANQQGGVPSENSTNNVTNYGANVNQSTYMQSGQIQDSTYVTFTSNQVSSPKEEIPEPSYVPCDTDTFTNVESVNSTVDNAADTTEQTITDTANPEEAEAQQAPTTFDLLSDIDFSVEHAPLTPEIKVPQISESVIKKPVTQQIEPIVKTEPKEEVIQRPPRKEIFADPSLLNNFTQEVKKLQNLVDSLSNKTTGGLVLLDSKWKKLQDVQAKENANRSKIVAMRNTQGTVVTEIVPYDDSRVILKSERDAYINASYYKQLSPWCIPLVLSNIPEEKDYVLFWKAVLQNNVNNVVCLQSEIEMQARVYWPTAIGQKLEFKDAVLVSLLQVSSTVHWTERKLIVSNGKTEHTVMHYQINVFPKKIVCSPLVLLVDKILSKNESKLWVQCTSGGGRSAILASLIAVMSDVRAGNVAICDLLDEILENLYKHRTNVLEDTKYLADAFRTALFYVQGVLVSGTTNFNGESIAAPAGASILPPVTHTNTSAPNALQKPTKFSRESFEEMKQSPGLKSGDMKDPLNFLDPLWSLKKK